MVSIGLEKQFTRRALIITCIAALILAFMIALPQPAQADKVTPPDVPGNIQVPAGSKLFLEGHAVGTQNYVCMPSGSGFAWAFYGPQATLFNDRNEQIITHFLSPNPDEGGTGRATWQHSRDSSAVWAMAVETSSDSAYVQPGAIPWLKLEVVGSEKGPTGGGRLARAHYIQRVNTTGGIAPTTGCAGSTDTGKKAFVPYTADYYFYR